MLILPQNEIWPSQCDPLKAGKDRSLTTVSAAARQASYPNAMDIWDENSTVSGRAQQENVRIWSKSPQVLHDVDRARLQSLLTEGMFVARRLTVVMFLRLPLLAS